MARLNGRVRRLEGRAWQCPECGWPPAPGEKVDVEVIWPELDWDDPDHNPEGEPEACSTCGEPTEIVVRWLDLPDDELERKRHENTRRRLREGNPDESA